MSSLPPRTRNRGEEERPPQAGAGPPRSGLFLLPGGERPWHALIEEERDEGVFVTQVPAGRYHLSLEIVRPGEERGARLRRGLALDSLPPGIPAVSDLLLVEGCGPPPKGFEEAVARARRGSWLQAGRPAVVAWETYGPGLERETLEFTLSLERDDRGLVRRAAEWLGVVGTPGAGPPLLDRTRSGRAGTALSGRGAGASQGEPRPLPPSAGGPAGWALSARDHQTGAGEEVRGRLGHPAALFPGPSTPLFSRSPDSMAHPLPTGIWSTMMVAAR